MINKDALTLKGKVEYFITKGTPKVTPSGKLLRELPMKMWEGCDIDFSNTELLEKPTIYNILVDQGKDKVITALTTGFTNVICRMAIGDQGALPSDPTVPKVPTSAFTSLYNEVYRADADVVTLNVGTPGIHEVKFVKTFSAAAIPLTSFSNQAAPKVNEVGLITADLLGGQPLPRPAIAAPATPLTDERLFSIRTFKSVPFEAANDIAVTVRYTIFIE